MERHNVCIAFPELVDRQIADVGLLLRAAGLHEQTDRNDWRVQKSNECAIGGRAKMRNSNNKRERRRTYIPIVSPLSRISILCLFRVIYARVCACMRVVKQYVNGSVKRVLKRSLLQWSL